ncbi:class II histocompatibility antigen, B-L beta chain-like, partial [Neopelma chrysocephalum]|uniref:class II histocompatibility antigen, B-L beta chain-like n=1 Tax=Neopelma chrysocephalum TaxID=114329 RepID=UPI000FCD0B83
MTHQSPARTGHNTAPNRSRTWRSQPIRALPKSPKTSPPGWFWGVSSCPALGMERVRGAGAVLAVLVVLGAPPAAGEELSGVFQHMAKFECYFMNGTERVRYMHRRIYNREQYLHFDSDVGVYVGDTLEGESQARYANSHPDILETTQAEVDRYCRHNYRIVTPFSVERR